ncbi:MAG: hypothetical protein ACRD2G_03205, partial [Terriglobia bacterium]
CQDSAVTKRVVELKVLIEQMREQVQNLEYAAGIFPRTLIPDYRAFRRRQNQSGARAAAHSSEPAFFHLLYHPAQAAE